MRYVGKKGSSVLQEGCATLFLDLVMVGMVIVVVLEEVGWVEIVAVVDAGLEDVDEEWSVAE
jgi:TRAP-type C4-dicarboxylate transport system permease small subunit